MYDVKPLVVTTRNGKLTEYSRNSGNSEQDTYELESIGLPTEYGLQSVTVPR